MATSINLFEQSTSVFAGAVYDEQRDGRRLTTQLQCIKALVVGGRWYTVTRLTCDLRKHWPEINFPENSVQAQLRNLRKMGYEVQRRNVAEFGQLYEYRVLDLAKPTSGAVRRENVDGKSSDIQVT